MSQRKVVYVWREKERRGEKEVSHQKRSKGKRKLEKIGRMSEGRNECWERVRRQVGQY